VRFSKVLRADLRPVFASAFGDPDRLRCGNGTLREATGDEILGVAREYISKRIRRGVTLGSPRATRDYLTLRFGLREHEGVLHYSLGQTSHD
jgi:hypothetical protein